MTLGGNQKIEENKKLTWKIKDEKVWVNNVKTDLENKFNILLKPMQIRTFVVEITKLQHSLSTTTGNPKAGAPNLKITFETLFLTLLLIACFNNNNY